MVTPAAVVVSAVQLPLPVCRSMRNPVSLPELSAQVSVTCVADVAVARRFEGAAGNVAGVVAVAVFETLEVPALFVADTRYEYCVLAAAVVSEKLITLLLVVVSVVHVPLVPVIR